MAGEVSFETKWSVDAAHAVDRDFFNQQFGFNNWHINRHCVIHAGLGSNDGCCGGGRALHTSQRTTPVTGMGYPLTSCRKNSDHDPRGQQ